MCLSARQLLSEWISRYLLVAPVYMQRRAICTTRGGWTSLLDTMLGHRIEPDIAFYGRCGNDNLKRSSFATMLAVLLASPADSSPPHSTTVQRRCSNSSSEQLSLWPLPGTVSGWTHTSGHSGLSGWTDGRGLRIGEGCAGRLTVFQSVHSSYHSSICIPINSKQCHADAQVETL